MKRILALVLCAALLTLTACTGTPPNKKETLVVASFYPIYIFAKNLTKGLPEVTLRCMAEQNVGCLHDYQLLAKDAKLLADAKALLINGAGMEGFLSDAVGNAEDLQVIDSSSGVTLLGEGSEYTHLAEANSHIWMSVENAKQQVKNLSAGLQQLLPEDARTIAQNEAEYLLRLDALHNELREASVGLENVPIITFHEAYDYMAKELGLRIEASIESDEGGEPGAKELTELVETIRSETITALFTEPDYRGSAAEILSAETGANIYVLNPVVRGEDSPTAYEDIMRENIRIIRKAVG